MSQQVREAIVELIRPANLAPEQALIVAGYNLWSTLIPWLLLVPRELIRILESPVAAFTENLLGVGVGP